MIIEGNAPYDKVFKKNADYLKSNPFREIEKNFYAFAYPFQMITTHHESIKKDILPHPELFVFSEEKVNTFFTDLIDVVSPLQSILQIEIKKLLDYIKNYQKNFAMVTQDILKYEQSKSTQKTISEKPIADVSNEDKETKTKAEELNLEIKKIEREINENKNKS